MRYDDRDRYWNGLKACSAAALLVASACAQSTNVTAKSSIEVPAITAPFEQKLAFALGRIEAADMPVIVAYSHEGGEVQVKEYGALVDDGIPPELTQIDINSVTKTVTGIMAAKLAEQGKVRFDERLDQVFDDVPADKAGITLHQLLTHSAGLVDVVGEDHERMSKEEFLDRIFSSDLISTPGNTYRYSNAGYSVVAAIIEERSGKTYDAFLGDDVMAGLGLSNTGYMSVYDDARSIRTAKGKTILEASWGGHEPYWNLIGNGGLVSTVPEMIAFRLAVTSGKVIPLDMLEIVQTPHINEDEAATSFYGYGLVVQDVEGVGRFYWHNGGNRVFSAQWGDYSEQVDILFTAGADSSKGNAFEAMGALEAYLYGYGDAEN